MSLFDTDIITRSLRVGDGYNVHMKFLSCSNYNLNDLFYGNKLWNRDIDHPDAVVCKIFEQVTLDMFSVWIKESELGLYRTLREYLHKHYLRHNMSGKFSFSKKGTNEYLICFNLPEVDHWSWGVGGRTIIYPEIKVMFIPK